MKILHVIPSVDRADGGPTFMLETLARGLSGIGMDIDIATTAAEPSASPVTKDGVRYWRFARQTRFYKFSRPLWSFLSRHAQDYDVIHIHALFSWAPIAAAFWARRRGVPYIVRPLGTLNHWGMQNRRPWIKQLSFRLIEKSILAGAAFVHYTSEQELREAASLAAGERSEIIPNPATLSGEKADRGAFRASHPELQGRRIVLFLSRFDRKKGLDLLLPAFASLRAQCPDAALVLAGSGDKGLEAQLREQSIALGISDHVFWPGFLSGTEKAAAFADADVFVLPSYSENFGIAVVEAMAAGCPAVVSDQVAIHDDIKSAGAGVVVRCDARELAEALSFALSDAAARARMGSNGRQLSLTRYSLDSVAAKLAAAYQTIAS